MKPRILKPGDVVKYNQRAHDIIPNVIDNNRHTVAVVTNLPDWEEIEFTDGDICDGRWLKPVSMIRDNQKHIILYSDDLVRPSKDKSINSIDLTDFQREALSVEDMRKASTIVYQSDDGDVKILKDKENGVIIKLEEGNIVEFQN